MCLCVGFDSNSWSGTEAEEGGMLCAQQPWSGTDRGGVYAGAQQPWSGTEAAEGCMLCAQQPCSGTEAEEGCMLCVEKPWSVYWLVLCVNLTQAGVITEKGASVGEMPP